MMPSTSCIHELDLATRIRHSIDRPILVLGCISALSVLLFAATVARFGNTAFTTDAHLYYIHAHSWYFDHDIDYANNMAADPTLETRDAYIARRGLHGRVINIFPCGWSLAALPFFALADAATLIHNLCSPTPLPRDGFGGYFRIIIPLGHVMLGLVGLIAAYVLAARHFPRDVATAATALVWIGTNVCYFISVEPTMSHAASLCFVSMTLLLSDTMYRSGWTLRRAAALGGSIGMMCAVRHQDVAWIVVPLILLTLSWKDNLRRPNGHGVIFTLGCVVLSGGLAALCLLPQIMINYSIFGTPTGGAADFVPDWLHPKLIRDLILPPGGLLVLFPLMLVALMGIAQWVYSGGMSRPAAACALGFLACLYINACGVEGTSRRYVCAAPVFILGLCAAWQAMRRHRAVAHLAVCCTLLLVAKNILLMFLVDRGLVDRFLFTSVIQDSTPMLSAMVGSS